MFHRVPFSEHCQTLRGVILGNCRRNSSQIIVAFPGTGWTSLQRKQLLGIFVQYLFFRLVR